MGRHDHSRAGDDDATAAASSAITRAGDDDAGTPPGPRFTRGLGEAVYSAALDYLEANRDHLLEEIAARSRMVAE